MIVSANPSPILLRELVDRYRVTSRREHVKHGRSTSSQSRVKAATHHLLAVVIPPDQLAGRDPAGTAQGRALAAVAVEDLTREDLRDYLSYLLTLRNRSGQRWTVKSVNEYRATVLKMLDWAEDEELVLRGVHARLKSVKPLRAGKTAARRPTKIRSASREVVFALIDFCRRRGREIGHRTVHLRKRQRRWLLVAIALELMWELGSRPGELVTMRPCDIQRDPDSPGWLYKPSEWKTEHEDGERRILYVSDRARQLIDEANHANHTDGNQGLLRFAIEHDYDSRIFPWKAAHPYHATSGFYHAVAAALKLAGLPHQTNQQIRHAFATRAAAINVEGTRVQLGHRSINTTVKYIDADGPAVRSLFDQLAEGGPRRPDPDGPPAGPPSEVREPRLRLVGA